MSLEVILSWNYVSEILRSFLVGHQLSRDTDYKKCYKNALLTPDPKIECYFRL